MRIILLFFLALMFCGAQLFAQSRITGKILDSKTKESLIGATVVVKGTTIASSAALDGSFKITIPAPGSGVLVFTYIGYVSKEITVSTGKALGTVLLEANSSSLGEVTITSDVAVDRKTPIAVSTINAQFIEEKLGNQDIPELLSGTPSVQATQAGGGYGDSRINIRGFSSGSRKGNVALTINGIPVNDMENGSIFWSNWSGLTDVTTSLQIQRGLGASKIVVPSFGGTINIITRSTDITKGGSLYQGIGSDGYLKTGVSFSTGLDEKGWAITFSGNRTSGNGNADGLDFLGYSYFLNVTKVLSKTQSLSFNFMGATQSHGQRPFPENNSIQQFRDAPQGIRYNYWWGVKDGQPFDPRKNYFSKPLASITHHITLNESSDISTILYGTLGAGGGTSIGGTTPGRISNYYSPLDFTAAEQANAANSDGSALTYIKSSVNNHYWGGIRSTYTKNFANNLNLSLGIDGRYYEGIHYTEVTDLLGAAYVLDKYSGNPSSSAAGLTSGNINNPNNMAKVGDKISFYNKDAVASGGVFAQTEYTKNDITAFITLSATGTSDQRKDFFNYLDSDPRQSSPWVKFFSYQLKGGVNYNLTSQQNIFANIGYITKPPYFDVVFQKFTNTVNPGSVPEKLFSYELGYAFKSPKFNANLNLYHSQYNDQSFSTPLVDRNNNLYNVNISGVNELHQGAELELKYKPTKIVTINGMLSVGDWHYTKNTGPVSVYTDANAFVATVASTLVKGIKVGDAAQTTAALGTDIDVVPSVRLGANAYYYSNYTANFTFSNLTPALLTQYGTDAFTPYKIPSYMLLNLNAVFRFKIAGLDGSFLANVNNVLNTKYLSDVLDANATGRAESTAVFYGLGRTFTTGIRVRF